MILLSAHQDKVLDTLDLSFDKGIMTGLLDNLVGILVLNLALFSEHFLEVPNVKQKI